MTNEKKEKKIKNIKSVSPLMLALCMVITVAVTVTITATQTRNSVSSALSSYHQANHAQGPKILVLDLPSISESFTKEGASPREALRGINAMLKLLEKEDYLVIDANSALSIPESYGFHTDDYQNLIELAEGEGLDVDEGVDDSIQAAEQFMRLLNSQ